MNVVLTLVFLLGGDDGHGGGGERKFLVFGDAENGQEVQSTVANERCDVEDGRKMQTMMMIKRCIRRRNSYFFNYLV